MENNITAVQFIKEQIELHSDTSFFNIDWNKFDEIIEKAKEMEKEQIVTTWNTAHQAGRFEGKGIAEENRQTFETYWELTFKSE